MSVAEGGERVQKWVLDNQPDRDDHDAGFFQGEFYDDQDHNGSSASL